MTKSEMLLKLAGAPPIAASPIASSSDSITVKTPFVETHPTALAIYCSDGRFTESVEEMVRTALAIDRCDVLAIPGGPALLDMSSASLVEIETMRPATSFLIQSHKIAEVCLIAHAGCGFYKKRYAGMPAERIAQRQHDDLRRAAEWLEKTHKVTVWMHYAEPAGGHVRFDAVERSS